MSPSELIDLHSEAGVERITAEEFLERWATRRLPDRVLTRVVRTGRILGPDGLAMEITKGLTPLISGARYE